MLSFEHTFLFSFDSTENCNQEMYSLFLIAIIILGGEKRRVLVECNHMIMEYKISFAINKERKK